MTTEQNLKTVDISSDVQDSDVRSVSSKTFHFHFYLLIFFKEDIGRTSNENARKC